MWFWPYLALFTFIAFAGIHDSRRMHGPIVTAAELAADFLSITGMLLYRFRPDVPAVYLYWGPIAIVIAAAYVTVAILDVKALRKEGLTVDGATVELSENMHAVLETAGIVFTAAVLIPAIWLNLFLGFPFLENQ